MFGTVNWYTVEEILSVVINHTLNKISCCSLVKLRLSTLIN